MLDALCPFTEQLVCSTALLALRIELITFIFAASQLYSSIVFELHGDIGSIVLCELRLDIFSADLLAELFLCFLLLLPALALQGQSHLVAPGEQTRLEEHLRKEKIDWRGGVLFKEGLFGVLLRELLRV